MCNIGRVVMHRQSKLSYRCTGSRRHDGHRWDWLTRARATRVQGQGWLPTMCLLEPSTKDVRSLVFS